MKKQNISQIDFSNGVVHNMGLRNENITQIDVYEKKIFFNKMMLVKRNKKNFYQDWLPFFLSEPNEKDAPEAYCVVHIIKSCKK